MKPVSSLIRLATIISVVGHPLLTASLCTIFLTYRHGSGGKAFLLSGLLLGGVILPVSLQTYRKVKQGHYTNFDVSDRKQRYQLYPTLLILLSLVTGIAFATAQPRPVCYGFVAASLLIAMSYAVNFFSKASLHTSVSFFLACILLPVNLFLGGVMVIFAFLIALSRLILKRHTVTELIAGALIGLTTGAGFYWFVG